MHSHGCQRVHNQGVKRQQTKQTNRFKIANPGKCLQEKNKVLREIRMEAGVLSGSCSGRECQCHLADGGTGLEENLFCL